MNVLKCPRIEVAALMVEYLNLDVGIIQLMMCFWERKQEVYFYFAPLMWWRATRGKMCYLWAYSSKIQVLFFFFWKDVYTSKSIIALFAVTNICNQCSIHQQTNRQRKCDLYTKQNTIQRSERREVYIRDKAHESEAHYAKRNNQGTGREIDVLICIWNLKLLTS